MKIALLLFLTLLNLKAQDVSASFCNNTLDSMPTQAMGRVKPLYVLASETFQYITGKSSLNKNPTQEFCTLTSMSLGLKNELVVPLKIEHIKSRELLGLKKNDVLNIKDALENEEKIKSELMTLKLNDSYKKDLNKVYDRIQTYKAIIEGQLWTLPQFQNDKIEFIPFASFVTEQNITKHGTGLAAFASLFEASKQVYIKHATDSYLVELTYKKMHPFSWSIVLVLIAIFLGVLIRKKTSLFIASSITILVQVLAIAARVYISGRAPITNMYETVMFSGFGALVISFGITLFKSEKIFLISGLAYNLLCLMMMNFAGDMLDSSISPLVPVLRDNFWLSTHVTTIILSYAALALSWILANIVIVKNFRNKLNAAEFNYHISLIYTCLKFGVVLLATGIILGGVWADYSWGRFWGWDPKETWSLIVLLIYMAILHGKYSNWINNERFAFFVSGAFLSVMMAWFGVNYILASGLHSYGFSEGGAIFLFSFFAIQISIIIIAKLKKNPAKA